LNKKKYKHRTIFFIQRSRSNLTFNKLFLGIKLLKENNIKGATIPANHTLPSDLTIRNTTKSGADKPGGIGLL
jgi:hypothetical protein